MPFKNDPRNEHLWPVLYFAIIFALFISLLNGSGLFYNNSEKILDFLLVSKKFPEALGFLNEMDDSSVRLCCTVPIVTRCVDLCQSGSGTSSNLHEIFLAKQIFNTLLRSKIDDQFIMTTALNSAIFHDDQELIHQLLLCGMHSFNVDEDDLSPLMYSIKRGRYDVFVLLIKSGAFANYTNLLHKNILHFAAANKTDPTLNFLNILEDLIRRMLLNANLVNSAGLKPLDVAIENRNCSMIKLLQKYTKK